MQNADSYAEGLGVQGSTAIQANLSTKICNSRPRSRKRPPGFLAKPGRKFKAEQNTTNYSLLGSGLKKASVFFCRGTRVTSIHVFEPSAEMLEDNCWKSCRLNCWQPPAFCMCDLE